MDRFRIIILTPLLCAGICFGLGGPIYPVGVEPSILECRITPGVPFQSKLHISTTKDTAYIAVLNWSIDKDGNSVVMKNQEVTGNWLSIPRMVKKQDPSLDYIEATFSV